MGCSKTQTSCTLCQVTNAAFPACRLPRAATCFNVLYLPGYSSQTVLQRKLLQATGHSQIFDEGERDALR